MRKTIEIILIIILILILFTGCSYNESEKISINDRINEEINYIDVRISSILNKYFERKDDVLVSIYDDLEKIDNILDVLVIDLSEYDLLKDQILSLRTKINETFISIENEQIDIILDNINDTYSLIPRIVEGYNQNSNDVYIYDLKASILKCITLSNKLMWDEAKTEIEKIENNYNEKINDINFINELQYNSNKIYISVEEISGAIKMEQLNLVNTKYIEFLDVF